MNKAIGIVFFVLGVGVCVVVVLTVCQAIFGWPFPGQWDDDGCVPACVLAVLFGGVMGSLLFAAASDFWAMAER